MYFTSYSSLDYTALCFFSTQIEFKYTIDVGPMDCTCYFSAISAYTTSSPYELLIMSVPIINSLVQAMNVFTLNQLVGQRSKCASVFV